MNEKQKAWLKFFLTILGTLILTIILLKVPINYQALGKLGYLGVFMGTFLSSATVILPSPALATAFIAGSFLNPWLVGLIGGIAASLGENTGFWAGRGTYDLAKRYGLIYTWINKYYRRYQSWLIFILSFIPSPLLDIAGLVAGSSGMAWWKFQLACWLGKTGRFILVAMGGKKWFSLF